jgi:hypothetical protein
MEWRDDRGKPQVPPLPIVAISRVGGEPTRRVHDEVQQLQIEMD